MSLTVHVGAHKTATTHLQSTLRAMIPALLRAGVHYSDVVHWRGDRAMDAGLIRLADRLARRAPAAAPSPFRPQPGGAAARGADPLRGDQKAVARVLDGIVANWPQVVLSEENILGRIRSDRLFGADNTIYPSAGPRVDALGAVLRRRPMRLCLSIREPAGFLTSAFAMQVLGGRELLFDAYLDGFAPDLLSWSGLAERLLAVPGVAGLTVWRYEDYPAIRPALFDRLLPSGVAAVAPDLPAVNVSMSQDAYEALRARAMAKPGGDLRGMARRAARQFPRRPGERMLDVVDAALARRCAQAYAEDCARLAAMPGVDLLTLPGAR
ncbi:hypothetical protein [Paracoccus luteus]|uniref:hypothetical protein n=1 Tax=Paracoccus luteus TaxID=2508543 RepID=UPI00107001F6|nr:hypothetical protein [Paracoccus luteus]